MAGTTTVILGGGFGGVAAANALRPLLGEDHRILLVDRTPFFHVGAGKTWIALGERTFNEISSPRTRLLRPGVECRVAEVSRLDVANGVVVAGDKDIRWDHLVIALGADLNPGAVPGFAGAAHSFYSVVAAELLRGALERFEGGDIVLLNPKMPIKCPAAPYEAAMLVHHTMSARGLREQTRIAIHTVEGRPMMTGGPEIGQFVRDELEQRGIAFHPQRQVERVDAARRCVHFQDGSEAHYDLLIAIPPHEAPKVVRDAGLVNESGWIPADPETLQVKSAPAGSSVYAIGDVNAVRLPGRYKPAVPLAMPKAGVIAASQGVVVAQRIAATVRGEIPTATFDGKGYCFLEMGNGCAVKADGAFFEMPHPLMQKRVPDEAQMREKLDWVARALAPVG